MKIGKWAILGLVGGLLGLVGVFLPWVSVAGVSVSGSCLGGIGTISVGGLSIPCPASAEGSIYAFGILGFSVLGLIFSLLGKKMTTMLSMIFGLLTLILAGVAIARVSSVLAFPGVSIGYGIILCIVGGVLLFISGLLAWMEMRKAGAMAPQPGQMMPPA